MAFTMGVEHQPKSELDQKLVAAYTATFIPRDDLYPLQLPDGSYTQIRRQLYPDLVAAHLKGFITIGAYALDQQNHAKWLCFDADDGLSWYGLVALARQLHEQHVPTYLEPSRRGGHLWLFTTPLPGLDIRRFGKQLLIEHNLPMKQGKQPGIELYPRQDELHTGPGSFVRLPLGKHRLTNRRYHFVTLSGEPLAPTVREQIALLAAPEHVPPAFITEVLERAPRAKAVSPTPRYVPQAERPKPARSKRKRKKTREPPSEQIKKSITVLDFVSQYVELDERGKGYCPFHDDQHKSFQVHHERNFWHCYAGCEGQTVIDFWMKWREKRGEDPSFVAAVKELRRMLL